MRSSRLQRKCAVLRRMVYLTKSQRDSRALFLALPCRNCGCGIRAKRKEEKDEKDGLGVDAHARMKACKWLLAERLKEEGVAAAGGAAGRTRREQAVAYGPPRAFLWQGATQQRHRDPRSNLPTNLRQRVAVV